MTNRDSLGRFTPGNQVAYQGWRALVAKRFQGDEVAAKTWWGKMGAWHYDKPYRERGLGAMPHPGQPEEFVAQFAQRFEFTLADVPEMEF